MPGRQAHGRPLLANPAARKNKRSGGGKAGGRGGGNGGAAAAAAGSRGLRTRQGGRVDVLALAEQQVGERKLKGVRLRDLDVERDQQPKRRRRDDDDDDDEDDEDAGAGPKRRRPNDDENLENGDGDDSDNELHSDSSGNEWREGVADDDDDSEIDSDEAFGDSDDEMFEAFSFRGSSSKQKPKKAKKPKRSEDDFEGFDDEEDEETEDDEDEDVGDDGADLGEDAIDLAQALDIVSSDEEEEEESKEDKKRAKAQRRKKTSQQPDDSDLSAGEEADSSDVSSMSGSDDEDSDSDGSDDEDDESSQESVDDEDEDEDEDLDADVLKGIAAKFVGKTSSDADAAAGADAAANPYQFALGDLAGVKDRSLRKTIRDQEKQESGTTKSKTLGVPLAPMLQDRQLRAAAADKAHETLGRWTETVKQNRRAEHLTFEVAGSLASAGLDPNAALLPIIGQGRAAPQTELEKTILAIMEESGLGPKAQQAAKEQEQLGIDEGEKQQLSPEELKALIGLKRRQRAAQSQEQARAKRIKKIKSKAYRRVHRREKAKAEALLADEEAEGGGADQDSEAEREAQHRRRALERMGARHRDSRWAKRAKHTGRAAWDDEFRAGLVDMARQDEELRRRVEGRGPGDRDSESESDEEDDDHSDEDDEAFRQRTIRELEQAGQNASDGTPSALMKIAFMQKAEQARKKANDEAVAEIVRELDPDNSDGEIGFGSDDEEDADKPVGRRSYGMPDANGVLPRAAALGSSSRRRAAAAATAAGENGEDEAPQQVDQTGSHQRAAAAGAGAWTETTAPGAAGSWTVVGKSGGSSSKNKAKAAKAAADAAAAATLAIGPDGRLNAEAAIDSLLAQSKVAAPAKSAKPQKAAAAVTNGANGANGDESDTSSSGSDSDDGDEDADRGEATAGRRHNHNRYQLSRRSENLLAAALGDDDAAAEFAREKVRQAAEEADAWADEDADRKKKDEFLPGWGSWVGEGVSKRAVKRDQKKVAGGGKGKGKGKDQGKELVRRDAKLERVIISERRVKKNDVYLASTLPHEFETRHQYERSLRLPVGPEWSTKSAFQDATKPRVLAKQGVVLPMARPRA